MLFSPDCCTVIRGAPRLVAGAPRCVAGAPRCVAGAPRLFVSAPSYSEDQQECPPRVWYSPEIDASKFTLHILSDTPGGFQWLKYILLLNMWWQFRTSTMISSVGLIGYTVSLQVVKLTNTLQLVPLGAIVEPTHSVSENAASGRIDSAWLVNNHVNLDTYWTVY